VRSVLGDFKLTSLLKLQGGKVMVGTNKNGVPNERSASILGKHLGTIAQSSTLAPLHIQRWDNALFNPLKKQILEDVEVPFIFLKASNSNLITCTNFFHRLCTGKVSVPFPDVTAYKGLDPKDGEQ
jgi:hypothetical protein